MLFLRHSHPHVENGKSSMEIGKTQMEKPFASKHARPSEIALLFFDTDLFKTYLRKPGMLWRETTWMWHQTMATVLCNPFPEKASSASRPEQGLTARRWRLLLAWWAARIKVLQPVPSPNRCCRHYLDYTVLDLHPCIPHLQEIFSQVSLMQLALPMTPADMVWVPSREVISLPNKILVIFPDDFSP